MSNKSKHFKPNWTDKDDDYLRKYYCDPDYTASAIGRTLGRSRAAVIGRANRLGLTNKQDKVKVVAGKTYKTPSLRKF